MRVEIDALENNKTLELVELSKEKKKLVGYKWVFTLKNKVDELLERYNVSVAK